MRETVPSDNIWFEHEAYECRPENFMEEMARIGCAQEHLELAHRRGVIVIGIKEDSPIVRIMNNTPARVFFDNHDASTEDYLTKQLMRESFYKSVFNEHDDELFKAEWPELFIANNSEPSI